MNYSAESTMFNKSKPSVDAMEIRERDYIFLKQKNDQLVKELIEMRSSRTKLNLDMDYLVKQKFHVEQKLNRIERIVSDIDGRSRQCLNRIIDCSTELTCIIGLVNEVRDLKKSLGSISEDTSELLGGSSLRGMADHSPKNRVLNQEIEENQESEENPESEENQESDENQESEQNFEEKSVNDGENTQEEVGSSNEFISRGGRSLPTESDWVIAESDMELEGNLDKQCSITFPERLSAIEEDPEYSLSDQEEAEIDGLNSKENSTTFFVQLPKTNINTKRGEHFSKTDYTDLSTNVEADSDLDNSKTDENTFQDVDKTTTPQKTSDSIDKSPPKSTPRRTTYIKRKSIGSPCPKSLEQRGSKKRKSFTPKSSRISTLERRKSRISPLLSSNLDSAEGRSHESCGIRRKSLSRSSLFPPEPDSSISPSGRGVPSRTENVKKYDNSLGCHPIEELGESTLSTQIKETGSPSEKSLIVAKDLSKMTNLISSTPISLQREAEVQPKNKIDSYRTSKAFSTSGRKVGKENSCLIDEHPSNGLIEEDDGTPIVKRRKRICTMYKYRPEDIYAEIITGVKKRRPKEEYYKSLLAEQSRSMNQSYLNESGTSFNRSKKCFNSTHKREESHLESPRSIGKRKTRIKEPENSHQERKDLSDDEHEPKTRSDHSHHNGDEARTSSKENKQRRGLKADANHKGENTQDIKSYNISGGFSTSGRKVGKEKTSLNDEHPSNNVTHEDGSSPIVKKRKRACTMYKYRPEDILAEIITGLENRKTRSKKRENRNEEKEEPPNDEKVHRTQSDGEYHTSNGGQAQASTKENKRRRGVKADASRKEENTQETESEGQPAEPNERKRRRAVKKVEYKEPSLNVKLRRE